MAHRIWELPYGDIDCYCLEDDEREIRENEFDEMDAKVQEMTEEQFNQCYSLMNSDDEIWCIGDAIDFVLGCGEAICQANGKGEL